MPRLNAEKRAAFISYLHEMLDRLEHPDWAASFGGGLYGDVTSVLTYQDGVLQDVTVTVTDQRKPLRRPPTPAAVALRRAG